MDLGLEELRDLEAAVDEAAGFGPLTTADYDAVASAMAGRDASEVVRALSWLCLMKQSPRGPWDPGVEIQGYLRALEKEASKP